MFFCVTLTPEHLMGLNSNEALSSHFRDNYEKLICANSQNDDILLCLCFSSVSCLIMLQFKLTHVVTLGIITALTEDGN